MSKELDVLVADKVMGWKDCRIHEFGCPVGVKPGGIGFQALLGHSVRIEDAWLVVEKMRELGWWCRIQSPFQADTGEYFVGFTPLDTTGWNGRPDHEAHAAAAPEAICRAALQALGHGGLMEVAQA